MAIDENFEEYIALSIEAEIKKVPSLSSLPLQLFGAEQPVPETVEGWLALDVLRVKERGSRPGVWRGVATFQVSCFSRDAARRQDKKAGAARRLAGAVRLALGQKHFAVCNYGVVPLVTLADIGVHAPSMVSVPPMDGSNVWSVVATFDSTIQTG